MVSTSSLFGQPFDRLFLPVSAVNLKLTWIQPNPGPPAEASWRGPAFGTRRGRHWI